MNKYLINVFSNKVTEEELKNECQDFADEYEIINYHIAAADAFLDIVGAIIESIKTDVELILKETIFIFQTNIADLAHFSYKFYSEILDAVVLCSDKVDFLADENKLEFLYPIINVSTPNLRLDKIYVKHKNEFNYQYLKFLNLSGSFKDIDSYHNFTCSNLEKMRHDLEFMIKNQSYQTVLGTGKIQYINCDFENTITQINLGDVNNPFGIYAYLQLIMNTTMPAHIRSGYIQSLEEHANDAEVKKCIEFIDQYVISSTNLKIESFTDYNHACMVLGDQDALIRQYNYLLKEKENLNPLRMHALITNSLFYLSKLNQINHPTLFKERMELIDYIHAEIASKIKIKKIQSSQNKIAIIAGQLLSINHAPTKWALDYANMLKENYPKYEIKIFVEDWANYSADTLTWGYAYRSGDSSTLKKEHNKYLHKDIGIYYSNSKLKGLARIKKDIENIVQFNPSVIYKMGSKYNLATDLLYEHYPIVSHTMGGAEDSNYVDIFTGGYKLESIKQMYEEQGITNYEYMYQQVGIETPKKVEDKTKSQYGLFEDSFILVTVGNRLENEMNIEFVEQIIKSLEENKQVQWLIVGCASLELLERQFKEYIESKQIIFVPYENNLFDLYKICDVYLNPIRQSGGTSAAIAMKAKLPVVSADPKSDVAGFINGENCINANKFTQEIQKLINNQKYYEFRSKQMQDIIENNFTFIKTLEGLKKIFERALQKFEQRKRDSK